MKSQTFNISIPDELVRKVDQIAKQNYTSRSDIIRRALLREIRSADEWETLADFGPQGVPAEDLIKALDVSING